MVDNRLRGMSDTGPDAVSEFDENLYALIVYLHASANRDLIEQLIAEQINYSQLTLLELLRGGHRRPTIRETAAILHMTAAGASRTAAALAKRGLITREPDETDYRGRRLMITTAGERTILRLHQARYRPIEQLRDLLDTEELEQLAAALERVTKRPAIAACRLPAAA